MRMLFDLGSIVATPAALNALMEGQVNLFVLLARHASGDWGDLVTEDKEANDQAVKMGGRILSSYEFAATGDIPAVKIWIITEADRSVTTILLPEDY